jgi:hypothetical protein
MLDTKAVPPTIFGQADEVDVAAARNKWPSLLFNERLPRVQTN